ncbi:MAG: sigma-70 family RNA polymerase sigma factor [Candidatus Theseobacter exili]|nr:sigma-70 family RNA polymerase sigma factor [Candidatus Theseobacter exili]
MDLVYNMAYKMAGNRQDAEDLVQETFLKAFRYFAKYQRNTNCKAWLIRILRNTYINRYRKTVKEPVKVDFEDIQPIMKDSDSKSENIISAEFGVSESLDDQVEAALSKLPDEYRTAVVLADIEEFSYDEISKVMECPVGTIRSRISRGRMMLRKELMEYAYKYRYLEGKPS